MKIAINTLGQVNHALDLKCIEKWKSEYFKIVSVFELPFIEVDHFEDGYCVPNEKLVKAIRSIPEIDLTIALVDQPLEGNYYMHRLGEKVAVVSIHPVKNILTFENIPLENYVVRCIYEMVCFWYECGSMVTESVYSIPHHETRGCLFDMNVLIQDIRFSSESPRICQSCCSRMSTKSLPQGFLQNVISEIKRIKKPLYFRILDWIREHPIYAIGITSIWALTLNILANFLTEIIRSGV